MNSGIEAKAVVGNVTVDVGQVIRNLTGVETDREKKSFLQKMLEPQEVDDSNTEIEKAKKIAKKIARGESVTPQEKALLLRVDPKMAQMAELAYKEYQRIKHALQNASSKEEQQNIVHQAYQMVTQVSKNNQQFGELLGEAVKAAVQDSRKKGIFREEFPDEKAQGSKDSSQQGEHLYTESKLPQQDEQQALLEQFFPEEELFLMDCKG